MKRVPARDLYNQPATSGTEVTAAHDRPRVASGVTIQVRRIPALRPSEVYETYWRFAAERQAIFFRRLDSGPAPWTDDPILRRHKFTNAYRASDRVSQYLIRHVIHRDDLPRDPREVVFRILLFKLFNRVETWRLLEGALGAITAEGFRPERYDAVLSEALRAGRRIYSAAYIMPPGQRAFGEQLKHRNHLRLLELSLACDLPERLRDANGMERAFGLLKELPTVGNFLAYQYAIDVNYSDVTNFNEMEFVVPGPGARDGIRKCFVDTGGLGDADIVRLMADRQEDEFQRLGLNFKSLWERPLQLVDCQNLFCEVDKYARVAHPGVAGVSGRTRIKQSFNPNDAEIAYWYPPKWGINHLVPRDAAPTSAPAPLEAL